MPNISTYLVQRFGIAVYLYYQDVGDHSAPHIHVRSQGRWASYRLPDGERLAGEISSRAEKKVQAWIVLNEEELMERWQLAVEGIPVTSVD